MSNCSLNFLNREVLPFDQKQYQSIPNVTSASILCYTSDRQLFIKSISYLLEFLTSVFLVQIAALMFQNEDKMKKLYSLSFYLLLAVSIQIQSINIPSDPFVGMTFSARQTGGILSK